MIYSLSIIGLSSFSLFKALIKHGQTFTINPFLFIFFTFLQIVLLFGTGFFEEFHWPQLVWFVLACGGLAVIIYDSKKEYKYNFFTSLISTGIMFFIYYKGGAFQYLG